jgi:hypothetical protein
MDTSKGQSHIIIRVMAPTTSKEVTHKTAEGTNKMEVTGTILEVTWVQANNIIITSSQINKIIRLGRDRGDKVSKTMGQIMVLLVAIRRKVAEEEATTEIILTTTTTMVRKWIFHHSKDPLISRQTLRHSMTFLQFIRNKILGVHSLISTSRMK